MATKRWLFVDYENIPTLEELEPNTYEKVIVFIGPQQNSIRLPRKAGSGMLDMQVVQITKQAKNNLDFHLAYYLGRLEVEAESGTVFEVLSRDNGFSPLVAFIERTGRPCKQLRPLQVQPGTGKKAGDKVKNKKPDSSIPERERLFLASLARHKGGPKKRAALVNHVMTHAVALGLVAKGEGNTALCKQQAEATVMRWFREGVVALSGSGKTLKYRL